MWIVIGVAIWLSCLAVIWLLCQAAAWAEAHDQQRAAGYRAPAAGTGERNHNRTYPVAAPSRFARRR